MAKKKVKKKKKKEFDARKYRAEGTARAIQFEIEEFSVDDVITNIYLPAETNFEKKLIKDIEKQLVLSKLNYEEFKQNLHRFFRDKANEIKKNNQYRDFFNFVQKSYEVLSYKDKVWRISCSYYDMMIQLSSYFVPIGKVVLGLDKDNETLLTIPEMNPDFDRIFFEVVRDFNPYGNATVQEELLKRYKKAGYEVEDVLDLHKIVNYERSISNMHFCMSPFIDSSNSLSFSGHKYLEPSTQSIKLKDDTFVDFPSRVFKLVKILQERKRLIGKEGLLIKGFRTDKLNFDEIFLQEKFCNNTLFMLYRIKTTEGTYTYGYYNTKTGFLYNMFRDSKQDESILIYYIIAEYVLSLYAYITTNIEVDEDFYIVENKNNISRGNTSIRKFDRNNLEKTFTEVDAYIRKLPVGAKASDEAIMLAKEYGIKLDEGETFVKPFKKKVYAKK